MFGAFLVVGGMVDTGRQELRVARLRPAYSPVGLYLTTFGGFPPDRKENHQSFDW